MISLGALALVAIVSSDQVALRAAPRDSAPQHALLWQGDSVEVRGARLDYVQVWDYRRERGGFVRASQLRTQALVPENADALLTIVRFLRDAPGAEAQGIAYVAAYLKAAPGNTIGAEAFDALGVMAERLAQRASARRGRNPDPVLAAHLEIAANYGVEFTSFERNGRMHLCYEGNAFRRVLALGATPEMEARAALALTRHDCIPPAMPAVERQRMDDRRGEVLDRIDVGALPPLLQQRIRLRRAGVWASLAHQAARRGDPAAIAGQRALDALAGVTRDDLSESDAFDYADAAVRTGASRWAAEPVVPTAPSGLTIETAAGEPGQTCVRLVDGRRRDAAGAAPVLAERCTWGVVWAASASTNAQSTALALAVQPLDAWRELWLFHKDGDTWRIDVLPPAFDDPDVGYLEFAGWVPAGTHVLAVREAKVDGRFKRSYELINLATLETEKRADSPEAIRLFHKWQSPVWKRMTVSLR